MLKLLIPLLLLCSSVTSFANDAGFVGSDSCRDCHASEHQAWQGSHHDLAMQLPGPDTVLGDFDDATFTYNLSLIHI